MAIRGTGVLNCMGSGRAIGGGKADSLKGEGAAVELLGSAKTSLLGRGTAEQQELVGGVHEFQLLPQGEHRGRERHRK